MSDASHENFLRGQLTAAAGRFKQQFGRSPTVAVAAPGRVNLIGEHTDYNDGFVLPMAIQRQTVIVAAPQAEALASTDGQAAASSPPQARIVSTGQDDMASFAVDASLERGDPAWTNYVRGVLHGCLQRGMKVWGFDAVVDSNVPLGGGLSSSAALEVATATLVEVLSGQTLDPADKALLCQQAEHGFAGVPCGIMDQFISTMGRAGHAMLLDCRSREMTMVPLDDPNVIVLIANSNKKHELVGGEYAQRRGQCEAAAQVLGAAALRDVTMSQLEAAKKRLEPIIYRRAHHVVSENARTLEAAECMKAGRWAQLGQLMYSSHASLRDDFEVSTPELDLLVALARGLGESGGVYGSRMTGGGFGGSTVSLVQTDHVDAVSEHLHMQYQKQTGLEPTIFATQPAAGASVIELL